ncbi:MAG: flagellar protein FlaG [Ignavibacteriales bacterium]
MKIEAVDRNLSSSKIEQAQSTSYAVEEADRTSSAISSDNKKISSINETERHALPVSEKFVIEAIERANKAIVGAKTEFKFSIHDTTHEISVKVLDKDSGEIIREIPPEKILDMVARMWEMAGIIVDEKR